ncbi:MerR family transcriptional regulator [Pseudonocardia phyllosphaerae]|uniref:MerR family transcriptional regulator n=1 Tax=Pseudonocardia phyllosphaerae TaxID=3390502 RepID=UPI00397B5A19
MSWSTREIAELAGTSLRTVRHYHDIGLLPEPERRANGYKQYVVAHLVRLLKIKRMTDLGFSLPQIAETIDDDEQSTEAVRALDDELAATIDRLQRVRAELATILDGSARTDLPAEFTPADESTLTEADRSFVLVMSRVLGPQQLQAYSEMVRNPQDDLLSTEFDAIPADADEATRDEIAARMAPHLRELFRTYPQIREADTGGPHDKRFAQRTVAAALQELYNPAQIDVIRRADELARQDPDD